MFANFVFFITHFLHRTYEIDISAEFADNDLFGCSRVVGINARKWSHLEGGSVFAAWRIEPSRILLIMR